MSHDWKRCCLLLILDLTGALAVCFPANAQATTSPAKNTNPNYTAIREYGYIVWSGNSATLVAGGSRPLGMAAYTLATCLGIGVSAEDPRYEFKGDLLDVTAPQWSAVHPDKLVYAGRPARIEVTFAVDDEGAPKDIPKLLNDAIREVNAQLPWSYEVTTRRVTDQTFYSFVPTTNHDASGELRSVPADLDTRVNIPARTASIADFAAEVTGQMTAALGRSFSCCQALVIGQPWEAKVVHYEAVDTPARIVLEDLLALDGGNQSYNLRCQPLDNRFCFINVHATMQRGGAYRDRCTALGYEAR